MTAMKKATKKVGKRPKAMKKVGKAPTAMKKAMKKAMKAKAMVADVKDNQWLKGQPRTILRVAQVAKRRKWNCMQNENLFLYTNIDEIQKITLSAS